MVGTVTINALPSQNPVKSTDQIPLDDTTQVNPAQITRQATINTIQNYININYSTSTNVSFSTNTQLSNPSNRFIEATPLGNNLSLALPANATTGRDYGISNVGTSAFNVLGIDNSTVILNLLPDEEVLIRLYNNGSGVDYFFNITNSFRNDFVLVSGTSQTIEVDTTYVPTNSSLTTFTLPTTANQNSEFRILGFAPGNFKVQSAGVGDTMFIGAQQATTSTGSFTSNAPTNALAFCCVRSSPIVWISTGAVGNFTST